MNVLNFLLIVGLIATSVLVGEIPLKDKWWLVPAIIAGFLAYCVFLRMRYV